MSVHRLDPGAVILDADEVRLVLAAIRHAQRARVRLDGLAPSPRLDALARALASASPSPDRADEPPAHDGLVNRITADEAALLLGVTDRHARRLAPTLGGVKVGHAWLLDAAAVAEHHRGDS